jgi:hypothetical protein
MRKPTAPLRSRIRRPRKWWLVPFHELDEDDDDFLIVGGGPNESEDITASNSNGK